MPTEVGEFEDTKEALQYFQRMYLPDLQELKRRLLFVQAANGDAVETICSWWDYTGQRRDPSVHWLAVRQAFQGLGLGRALVSECLNRLVLLEGHREVFLHTQTWSHKAIALYLKTGFEIVQSETFGGYKNDYDKAMPILRESIPLLLS
ncbi:MAG: hypothetical protein A2189_04230 [Paenibacillus sp. RIFOXYA1_FULL_44_5]|nr:MAG: hypothetical protein A2189_04230 [Paenibacillus sp. RIFOXYA1_FULL_44_5]